LLSSLLHPSQVGKHPRGPRGARQAFESEAFSLITLTNFGSGGGSCLPAMVDGGGFGRTWDACDLVGQYRGATKPIRDALASMPQLISMAKYSRSKLCFAKGVVRLDAEC
jgi:hypothetical protein